MVSRTRQARARTRKEEVALVHKIHILAMAYVLLAALPAIVSRNGYESGQKELAKRRDLVGLCLFVVFNITLIAAAASAG
jgi:hypothetical protein